ncbi:hypothetical protein M0804_013268 [Polistes exclamans]|nr:hypothetical protein M0804_013268 [Polistes exclamans]
MSDINTEKSSKGCASILLEKFNSKTTDFLKWRSIFEYAIDNYNIENKNDYLLNMIDNTALTYIRQHIFPADPTKLSYKMTLNILEEQYTNLSRYHAINYRLNFRHQYPDESLLHYYNTLVKLLAKVDSSFSTLLFRFISGLSDPEIKNQLIKIPNLTPQDALCTALNIPMNLESMKRKSTTLYRPHTISLGICQHNSIETLFDSVSTKNT